MQELTYKGVRSTQQILFLRFLIYEAKTGLPICTREEICLGPWTVCMRGMDLELCTRDGCKKWATKELVPPNKFSSWVSWSVKQRLVFQIVQGKKFVFVLGLSACVKWKLEIVNRNIFVAKIDFKFNFTVSWSLWKLLSFLYFSATGSKQWKTKSGMVKWGHTMCLNDKAKFCFLFLISCYTGVGLHFKFSILDAQLWKKLI